ncbi:MAG: hypothetical protein ACKO24_00820 [Leptolyngbyaceae cyanobacterium]
MTPGTKIKTKSGRRGILITPPGSPGMPFHALIEFNDGVKLWIVAEAVLPV